MGVRFESPAHGEARRALMRIAPGAARGSRVAMGSTPEGLNKNCGMTNYIKPAVIVQRGSTPSGLNWLCTVVPGFHPGLFVVKPFGLRSPSTLRSLPRVLRGNCHGLP
jgi:hypothetical protein